MNAVGGQLNAVDMSRWGGELTAAEADALWAAGVRLVIVGTGDAHPGGAGEWARQQASTWLERTAAKGGQVDAYVYLLFAGDAGHQVRVALETMAGLAVRRWWLDAEDTLSPQLTPARRETFLDACVAALDAAGVAKGIYTGRWWWIPQMANSTRFEHLPLWNSYYDGNPDVSGLPYGGWTADDVAIEQFEGTTVLAGQSVDLNFARDLEEDDMTQEDRDRITRLETRQGRLERIVAGNGVDVVAETPAQLEHLRQVLGAGAELGKIYRLSGEAALAWLDADEASLELGLEGAEQRIAELEK